MEDDPSVFIDVDLALASDFCRLQPMYAWFRRDLGAAERNVAWEIIISPLIELLGRARCRTVKLRHEGVVGPDDEVILVLRLIQVFFERDGRSRTAGYGIAHPMASVVGRLVGFKPHPGIVLPHTLIGKSPRIIVNFECGILVRSAPLLLAQQ